MFGDGEWEHFRMLMRMQEGFSGSRVLPDCLMSNHFHLLLEVLPDLKMAEIAAFFGNNRWNLAVMTA